MEKLEQEIIEFYKTNCSKEYFDDDSHSELVYCLKNLIESGEEFENKIFIENVHLCDLLASLGDLVLFKRAISQGFRCSNKIVEIAAKCGNLELLKYFHEKDYSFSFFVSCEAAENGHLECLKFLHSIHCVFNHMTFDYALKNGHLECLKFLKEVNCPFDYRTVCITASEQGYSECLKFLCEKLGCVVEYSSISGAVRYGHINCIEYLLQRGLKLEKTLPKIAYEYKKYDCLDYLFKKGCPGSLLFHTFIKIREKKVIPKKMGNESSVTDTEKIKEAIKNKDIYTLMNLYNSDYVSDSKTDEALLMECIFSDSMQCFTYLASFFNPSLNHVIEIIKRERFDMLLFVEKTEIFDQHFDLIIVETVKQNKFNCFNYIYDKRRLSQGAYQLCSDIARKNNFQKFVKFFAATKVYSSPEGGLNFII
jgi:hypothetical protein